MGVVTEYKSSNEYKINNSREFAIFNNSDASKSAVHIRVKSSNSQKS